MQTKIRSICTPAPDGHFLVSVEVKRICYRLRVAVTDEMVRDLALVAEMFAISMIVEQEGVLSTTTAGEMVCISSSNKRIATVSAGQLPYDHDAAYGHVFRTRFSGSSYEVKQHLDLQSTSALPTRARLVEAQRPIPARVEFCKVLDQYVNFLVTGHAADQFFRRLATGERKVAWTRLVRKLRSGVLRIAHAKPDPLSKHAPRGEVFRLHCEGDTSLGWTFIAVLPDEQKEANLTFKLVTAYPETLTEFKAKILEQEVRMPTLRSKKEIACGSP